MVHGKSFDLAEQITPSGPSTRPSLSHRSRIMIEADRKAAKRSMSAAWHLRLTGTLQPQRVRAGHGSKGLRHYDWALLEVTGDDTPVTIAMTGTACCWCAGTATQESCRSPGAGHPGRCRWHADGRRAG